MTNWLHGLNWFQPCSSAAWRQEYDEWIKQDPEMRGQFADHPTSTILACSVCGDVVERRGAAMVCGPICTHGHGHPQYVRFGEHERAAVQEAVERWQEHRKAKAHA